MINKTDLKFEDISSEEFREYVFDNDLRVRLESPQYLHVSKHGGHRVFTADGMSHYVPCGWVHLFWKAREGEPNFVK